MRVQTATEPARADRSNEDWLSATPGLVVVLDGATARTDTGCEHGVAWFAQRLGVALVEYADNQATSLPDALSLAIRSVADQHPQCDLSSPGTPSAAVGVVRLVDEHAEFLVLGDVTTVLDMADGVRVVVDERVEETAVAERREADRHLIGSAEKAAALVRMKHAELAARNRTGGFWTAAADQSVAAHAIIGTVALRDLRRVAVLTDGAARIVRLFGALTWAELLALVEQAGPAEVIRRVRSLEEADPVAERWPRNKRSDDASLVYLS